MVDINPLFKIKHTYYILHKDKQQYRPRQRQTPLGKMEQITQ